MREAVSIHSVKIKTRAYCIYTLTYTFSLYHLFHSISLCLCSVNEYISFGLSGRDDFTFMDGADVVVTWVDGLTGTANAVDYLLSQRVQVGYRQNCMDAILWWLSVIAGAVYKYIAHQATTLIV